MEGFIFFNSEQKCSNNSTSVSFFFEYLMYFYELFGVEKENADQHISYLLNKVGLSQRSHTLIGQFSRGMKQRLGLAQTLINHPKVIFLDEPTLGLDPTGQRDIHELIKELNLSMNITVFITSHLLKDIEVLCNKVAIVKNGKLLVEDTIGNLQKSYSDGEVVLIKTSDDQKAIGIIKSNGFTNEIESTENGLKITLTKGLSSDAVKQEIIESLFVNQVDIFEITKHKTTIEDVFLKLVGTDQEKAVTQ